MVNNSRLLDLHNFYREEPLTEDVSGIIGRELGVDLNAKYLDLPLKNPILIAPGQITVHMGQIRAARDTGYAGAVLKSFIGEASDGSCSMIAQRKKASYIRTFHEADDPGGEYPIIHWDGRLDTRNMAEYMSFARDAKSLDRPGAFAVIASLLCHLPFPGEDFLAEEWTHSVRIVRDAGYTHIEIDFCPFLAGDDYTEDQSNVLRWYRICPGIIKSVSPDIKVFPKLLNLDWGIDFQLKMAEAAVDGGSDGLVVANRIYKREYASGHGGVELRERNLIQIREIKRRFPELPVSGTGGIYSGAHILEYLAAGAENVQILSFIMGKVNKPFAKTNGSKLEKVFHKLMLDPEDGLVACMLKGGVGNCLVQLA